VPSPPVWTGRLPNEAVHMSTVAVPF